MQYRWCFQPKRTYDELNRDDNADEEASYDTNLAHRVAGRQRTGDGQI